MRGQLQEVIAAFEAVVPGYAWAWHDYNIKRGSPTRRQELHYDRTDWHDRRRSRLAGIDYRMLVYFMWPVEDRRGWWTFSNRGYVPLFEVELTDDQVAELAELQHPEMGRDNKRRGRDGRTWFTDDGTPVDDRARIAVAVLEFVASQCGQVAPLWQERDLDGGA